MSTIAYGERDYTFGRAMLTLRTEIGLTQAGLANALGVSRRAVGDWEAGSSYPKAEHLKELIALAIQKRVFPEGSEVSEIRALWRTAHQKVLLDESWLASLLSQQCAPHLRIVALPVEESMAVGTRRGSRQERRDEQGQAAVPTSLPTVRSPVPSCAYPPIEPLPASGPRVDWGDALVVPIFYGREEERAQLSRWIVQERCRVVCVLGMGGIGKSALSVSTMYQLAVGTAACPYPFEVIIFRSLRDTPSCEDLLADCLRVLSAQPLSVLPATLEQRISLMLSHLRTRRALVVLDNLESLLEVRDVRGRFRPGFEGYGQLLRRVAETGHQSCLLLTSREKPAELRSLESKLALVRSLRLSGLGITACKQLFMEKEVIGTEQDQEQLIELYGGNPLALKIVAEIILDLFGSEIGELLAEGTFLLGGVSELLSEQFARLSALEQSVLCWLAIAREPVTLDELLEMLVTPLPRVQVLEAVDSLYRRSLIERGKYPGSFTLQSVVLEYVTTVLIAETSREIPQDRIDRLIEYSFSQAHAKEYVRQTQERLLLSPLLANLQSTYLGQANRTGQEPRKGAMGTGASSLPTPTPAVSVEEQLLSLLNQLRELPDSMQGYGPVNLIALLRLLHGHLNGLDLSRLSIRGAYLQSVEMQDASMVGSLIRDSVWTSAASATRTVAISLDGKWWAAGSQQGQVHVWEGVRLQTLRLNIAAHTDTVQALAFSPNGRTLATGSTDGTVKLWDLDSGALLWTGWQSGPLHLAFSPDGLLLASGGQEATVQIWDPQSGRNLQTLTHPSPVFAVAFSTDGGRLASGCVDGQIHLWERQQGSPTTYTQTLSVQSDGVSSLTFAPDGRTLASTSLGDMTVKLWETGNLCLLHTLPEHADQSRCVAWSPDSSTLAYSSPDKAIRLWDVAQGSYRAALVGHTADVYGLAFTLNGNSLLSGSTDGTLRVWDVQSKQCVRVVANYGVSLWDLDWSPDSKRLISGGADALVTIWDLCGSTPPRILQGHSWIVMGVGWSPDGRYLSSCGVDALLFLWDASSGASVQRFEDPKIIFQSMAWSSDGSLLACGTYQRGIQVWNATTRSLCWIGQTCLTEFRRVAWSPNGTRLAGGGEDGCVYLWEGANNNEQAQDKEARKETSPFPIPTPTPMRLQGHHGRIRDVRWSPDGRWLASSSGLGDNRGELFVWNIKTGERAQTFLGCFGIVHTLAWTPNGDLLISGGSDGLLRWWDVQSGECVHTQETRHRTIRCLKVSPDGKFLASCGDDGAIRIWDLCSGGQVQGQAGVGTAASPVSTFTAPLLLRTLRRNRPYERLNITGIRGLNEVEIASLRALGAIETEAGS